MAIYGVSGAVLQQAYKADGSLSAQAYDINGTKIHPDDAQPLPVPTGILSANSIVPLPDIYEPGKGFTCTGLAYDADDDLYLVGDIGILQPNTGTIKSQIVKVSHDFTSVIGTIPIYSTVPNIRDIQGITIDTSDDTIWICSPGVNLVANIAKMGELISTFTVSNPTGISYDHVTDTLWICTTRQHIMNCTKSGTVLSDFVWNNSDTLDQCFIDGQRNILYFDCGVHYSEQNYLYAFDTVDQTVSIACTLLDSYSVEGISLEHDRLVIVNDGYYHSALSPVNQANIYLLT